MGTHPDLSLTKGLQEALENKDVPVATNYLPAYAEKMNLLRQNFKGGKALFTAPASPIKCGGAPQKIMYLSAYEWQKKGLEVELDFYTGTPTIFPNPYYGEALKEVALGYNTNLHFKEDLVEIDPENQVAKFKNTETGKVTEKEFDLLHATPQMRAPALLTEGGLTNANSYVNVNTKTL